MKKDPSVSQGRAAVKSLKEYRDTNASTIVVIALTLAMRIGQDVNTKVHDLLSVFTKLR